VVNARGKYLIPGLWDLHVHPMHLASVIYPLFLANGVTGIRDPASDVSLDTLLRWRREILAGARVGPPRQLLSGKSIDERPLGSYWTEPCVHRAINEVHICIKAGDTADARHVVDSLKAAGADLIKPYALSKNMYFVLAAAARRAGLLFGGHLDAPPSAVDASDSGASILDHVSAAGDLDTLCWGPKATVARCRPAAEHLARHNTWWVPTWIAGAGMGGGKMPKGAMEGFVEFVHQFWVDSTTDSSLQVYLHRDVLGAEPPYLSHEDSTINRNWATSMAIVRQAGLPILAGTDAAGSQLLGGFTLHLELATYVAVGLTPLDALRAATLNPAKFLHGIDSLGTVAPGKLADLVLLDADPLADITNTTRIRAVVANGRYFDRTALDRLLAEARARAMATKDLGEEITEHVKSHRARDERGTPRGRSP
jgi:hypothetical protein